MRDLNFKVILPFPRIKYKTISVFSAEASIENHAVLNARTHLNCSFKICHKLNTKVKKYFCWPNLLISASKYKSSPHLSPRNSILVVIKSYVALV